MGASKLLSMMLASGDRRIQLKKWARFYDSKAQFMEHLRYLYDLGFVSVSCFSFYLTPASLRINGVKKATYNRKAYRPSRWGMPGISKSHTKGKWTSRCRCGDRKTQYIGTFRSKRDASQAYMLVAYLKMITV